MQTLNNSSIDTDASNENYVDQGSVVNDESDLPISGYPTFAMAARLNNPDSLMNAIPFQQASTEIWEKKYQLRDKEGNLIDDSMRGSYRRVANALASLEAEPVRAEWAEKFVLAMECGAIPAGRIMSNAGAEAHKPGTSLINCTVSGTIPDSMDGILSKVHEAGMTLKAGCGIGYEFSTLRPAGALVAGVGAYTSGPMSFMDIYDRMCFTVSSAGGRRGAQMGTFDVHHPDAEAFTLAKREDGRLRQFNLSLLITEDFIEAVRADKDWHLSFPMSIRAFNSEPDAEVVTRSMPWLDPDRYARNPDGEVYCKVYKTIKARDLWDKIMENTYDYAEPGFILIDRVNRMNNNWFCENIRATNPCGEQPLPPYGSCLLGSINLTAFVDNPFTAEARFDWRAYEQTVRVFTRMLDNVVELNGLPLEQQRQEIQNKRRHGMGFLGLGSTLAMLGIKYGSKEACDFTEKVSYKQAINGWEVASELAVEKGAAPALKERYRIDNSLRVKAKSIGLSFTGQEMFMSNPPQMVGNQLLLMSNYMQQFNQTSRGKEVLRKLAQTGSRFTHHSSIAPTGTISLSLANNASNGIEPSFAHHYNRNVIMEGSKAKVKVDVYSYEMLAYREFLKRNNDPRADLPADKLLKVLPESFIDSEQLTAREHVDMQAAAQKWVDSSISKTCNVPITMDFDEFKDIYLYAAEKGLKGCTTFRFNPAAFQGVLVTTENLKSTTYQFTLEDGTTLDFTGDQEVEYDGQTFTAANLFDAIKEGYYGKIG